jgi:hypothetical protein
VQRNVGESNPRSPAYNEFSTLNVTNHQYCDMTAKSQNRPTLLVLENSSVNTFPRKPSHVIAALAEPLQAVFSVESVKSCMRTMRCVCCVAMPNATKKDWDLASRLGKSRI